MNLLRGFCALLTLLASMQGTIASSLTGTRESVNTVFERVVGADLPFARNEEEIFDLVSRGSLTRISENENIKLVGVSYAYAHPATRSFLEELGKNYVSVCGERMVVTSLLRPIDRQPFNASIHSLHPAGIAADLRVPRNQGCREWLEQTLIDFEDRGIIDATRERSPPHYHVAVLPQTWSLPYWVPPLVAVFAILGLVWLWKRFSKRERLALVCAITVLGILPFLLQPDQEISLFLPIAAVILFGVLLFWKMRGKRRRRHSKAAGLLIAIIALTAVFFFTLYPVWWWKKTANDFTALATTLYWEGAIDEPVEGLHAIAWTVFNRRASSSFPDTIREVVVQGDRPGRLDGCQFSFVCDGETELPYRLCELHPRDTEHLGWMGCQRRYLAHLGLAAWWLIFPGNDPTGGAVLYYTGPEPYWAEDLVPGTIRKIGSHTFGQSKWLGRDIL